MKVINKIAKNRFFFKKLKIYNLRKVDNIRHIFKLDTVVNVNAI